VFFNEINDLANFADFDKPHEFNGLAIYATTPRKKDIRDRTSHLGSRFCAAVRVHFVAGTV
jgi:hypothetical protein